MRLVFADSVRSRPAPEASAIRTALAMSSTPPEVTLPTRNDACRALARPSQRPGRGESPAKIGVRRVSPRSRTAARDNLAGAPRPASEPARWWSRE
jgi:hypothetical protein